MKPLMKIAAALSLALLFALPATAQIQLNPKAGLNFSGVDARLQDIRAEARVGWNAGLDFRMGQGAVHLQPGLHYYNFTARLMQEVSSPNDVELEDETTIQSLKLPVNLGLRLTGEGGLLNLHARGGITPTYILGVDEKPGFAFNKDDLNNFTWGANIGLGMDFLFLTVDANYEIGLTDFFANAEGGNNVFSLSLGLRF